MKYTLGIDIGGTTIKGGIVSERGAVIKSASIPAHAKRGQQPFLHALDRIITLLGTKKIRAIGIGCPGPLDPFRGIIISPGNIPLRDFPLRAYLMRRYRKRVVIDNDANAFTLAEATYGAGKHHRSVIGLTLGTGVGGGIVINKTIEHGRGNGGELGHVTLKMDTPRGHNRDIGCLQEHLRGEPMQKYARKLGIASYSLKELYLLGRRRKRAVTAYWKMFGFYCGIGIASLIHVIDPDMIVIGGQIGKAFSLFRKSMFETVRDRTIFDPPPIRRSVLGDNAGIIGAALLTKQK